MTLFSNPCAYLKNCRYLKMLKTERFCQPSGKKAQEFSSKY